MDSNQSNFLKSLDELWEHFQAWKDEGTRLEIDLNKLLRWSELLIPSSYDYDEYDEN